jgi:hypothetical protein
VIAHQLASFDWASSIEVVVLILVSLTLCRLGRGKDAKVKLRRRSRKLTVWVDGQRHRNRTVRPRSTTIVRLRSAKRFPAT